MSRISTALVIMLAFTVSAAAQQPAKTAKPKMDRGTCTNLVMKKYPPAGGANSMTPASAAAIRRCMSGQPI